MAEVIFVCVRADVEHAEALAETFEAVGFSTDGVSSAEDAQGAPAAIILWSEAALHSRAFLDAAQRQISAGNALIACLSDAPACADVDGAPTFDLSSWGGDPDDEAVDPLFFEVDRRVMAARAAESKPAPRVVALHADTAPPPVHDVAEAETDYFAQYGADAFGGLPMIAWSAPVDLTPDASPRPPRSYRGWARRPAIARNGLMLAFALLVCSGVAFAATSFAPPRQDQQVRHVAYENAPLSRVAMAEAPLIDYIPEPDEIEQVVAPSHLREPASAPLNARFQPSAYAEPEAPIETSEPNPALFEAELSDALLPGAPLIAAAQEAAAIGSVVPRAKADEKPPSHV